MDRYLHMTPFGPELLEEEVRIPVDPTLNVRLSVFLLQAPDGTCWVRSQGRRPGGEWSKSEPDPFPSRRAALEAAIDFLRGDPARGGSPQARERFVLGDVNTSLIKTRLGKTIILIHDTNLPRPYTRINLVQGTKGLAHKWPDRIYIEGRADKPHQWDDFRKFAEEFEHPLWKAIASRGEGRGHGGMDYIEDYRLVQSLLRGEPLDQDVYDAAAWSAVVGASVKSVAGKGRPVEIPDFTRGKWKTNPPLGIVEA